MRRRQACVGGRPLGPAPLRDAWRAAAPAFTGFGLSQALHAPARNIVFRSLTTVPFRVGVSLTQCGGGKTSRLGSRHLDAAPEGLDQGRGAQQPVEERWLPLLHEPEETARHDAQSAVSYRQSCAPHNEIERRQIITNMLQIRLQIWSCCERTLPKLGTRFWLNMSTVYSPAIANISDVVAAKLSLAGQRVMHAEMLGLDDPPQAPCHLQQSLPRSAPGDGTPQLASRLWKADHGPVPTTHDPSGEKENPPCVSGAG